MSEPRWQFSLKNLLALTTIVSVCLAVAVHYLGFMMVVLAVGVIQAGTLLSADWLIRPSNRRLLAFVTAASWIVMGCSLLIIGLRAGFDAANASENSAPQWYFSGGILFVAAVCYYIASRRWRSLTAGA
jgi:hypothetical protein